jgi:hypothetical protein
VDAVDARFSGVITGTQTATFLVTDRLDLNRSAQVSGIDTIDITSGNLLNLWGIIEDVGTLGATTAGGQVGQYAALRRVDEIDLEYVGLNRVSWLGDLEDNGLIDVVAEKLRTDSRSSLSGNQEVYLTVSGLLELSGAITGNGLVVMEGQPYRVYAEARFEDNGSCTLDGPEHRRSVGAPGCAP